jgi:hypothetical protein
MQEMKRWAEEKCGMFPFNGGAGSYRVQQRFALPETVDQTANPMEMAPFLRDAIWLAKRRRGEVVVPWEKFAEFNLSEPARRVLTEFYGLRLRALG